ncbi:AAA domain-containing protein [Russula aff. rugulosa BPL654]|nr:AAA domain-containing protein [Russula aff. rugulosa BPL654]
MPDFLRNSPHDDASPSAVLVMADSLRSALSKSGSERNSTGYRTTLHSLDAHMDRFVSVAYSRTYNSSEWATARTSVRILLAQLLKIDGQDISTTIIQLSGAPSQCDLEITALDVRKQSWPKIFASILPNDSHATSTIISIAAQFAHLNPLTENAFAQVLSKQGSKAKVAFNDVNGALKVLQTGYSEVISKYANYNTPAATEALLRRNGVAKDVTILMLCPSEDLQGAAQSLVGQAFDADVRVECFHAMLRNLTSDALEGIFTFLETFKTYATTVPEACDISKALVRCLTDVIEVLCSSPDSLLLDDEFLRSDKGAGLRLALPKFWTLMTESISVIFKRTPAWSKPSGPTLSRIGKKMIDDLQQFLPELTKWLRLTDEELLHQSFALLQSLLDCFKKTGVRPSEIGVQKLTRHIEGSRNKDAKTQTRLDSSRILKLEDTLAAFEDDDDDIVFISRSRPSKTTQQKLPTDKRLSADTHTVSSRRTKAIDTKPSVLPKVPSGQSLPQRHAGYFTSKDEERLSKESCMPRLQQIASSSSRHVQSKDSRHSSPAEKPPPSSDDSSDEGSGRERGLAALGKVQRPLHMKKPAERRQTKLLEIPALQENSALRRMRERDNPRKRALRMKPDISGLHRTILSWAYDHSGPDPPSTGSKAPLVRIPDRFSNYSHFQSVFEPLLFLECWAQILQSKEESTEMFESKVMSRQFVDDFVDYDLAILGPVKKGWWLSETDIILLRQAGGKQSVMAKVLNFKVNMFGQQHASQNGAAGAQHAIHVSARCHFGTRGNFGLQIGTTVQIGKVLSLSTLHREYAALMAMPHYECADFILKPQLPKPMPVDHKEVQLTMTKPPGTGKTSTICGLVQAFLSNRPQVIQANGIRSTDKVATKKILLCAPSNAAIDEIANRLKEGVSGAGRRSVIPKVVRVGTDKSINVSVKDISLDNLVDQKLDSSQSARGGSKDSASEIARLRSELETVRQLRQQKQAELALLHDNATKVGTLEEDIKKLNYRRVTIIQKLDRLRDQQKSDNRTLDAVRRKFRMDVLAEADVICSTLSGSGHDILEALEFGMIIIDEAAQAIELSSLIPLKYDVTRCVMVGDPQQLPPTVISQEATKYLYNQSLFVRLQKLDPDAVHLLSIQYRMHPDISQLPSRVFYKGRLEDGPGMASKAARPWHTGTIFGTYKFFNIIRGQESPGSSHSLVNKAEVQVAISLYDRLLKEFSSVDFNFRVGVVSMYRAQILELRRAFESRFGVDITSQVDFNTVDGFQGQEKDIIILSCVRAGPGLQNVGFLSDVRRMNVALTRARASLFILGHCPTLERSDKTWKDIITDARERGCLVEADANLFNVPIRPTRKTSPKPPAKTPKKAAIESQPIPTTLVAARSIGPQGAITPKSLQRPHVSPSDPASTSSPSVLIPASHSPSTQPSASTPDVSLIPPKPAVQSSDTKSSATSPAISEPTAGNGPKPTQNSRPAQPVKRPKQPPNLFIPKKRPAPGSGSGGPPNKKRA